ncbi:MAG: haloacid dehalogenase-like hydrolase [Kofleriaceae bacterium]
MILLLLIAACSDGFQAPAVVPDASTPDAPSPPSNSCPTPSAIGSGAWYGGNREQVTAWLDAGACGTAGFDPQHLPVVLLDWDNTISKNDFGDAITFWMIANDKVVQPPGKDWHATSPFLTDAAATALSTACGTTIAVGQPLPTSTNTACADEMLDIYIDEVTSGGADAFAGWNRRWIEPAYAWTAQLLAGYTHDEIQAFMMTAVTPQLAAPEATTQTIGTHAGLNAWLRIYPEMKSLIAAAQSRVYDVWIITASPQDAIAAVAPLAGIPASHVVGIRSMTDALGKLTYRFEGCGPLADGQGEMISYVQGKRCLVNKYIFGDSSAKAIQRRPDGARQVFAAGDSDTDIEFLRDATHKLVLNRNKKELMCNAFYNESNSWVVNPMFIDPKATAADYTCGTGCVDEAGATVACRDLGGNPIANQVDAIP